MKKITIPKITVADIKLWIESVDRKVLIQNAILGGGLLAFALFICLPVMIQAKKISTETDSLKNKITSANVKIARMPEMLRQKDQFGTRIKKIREEFFETQETDQLIEIISKAAVDSGVKISASRPSPKVVEMPAPFDKSYIPVSYELVVEGSYHAIGKFINTFEQYPKSFAIHELSISEGAMSSGLRESILTLTAFIKHPTNK